ncbi:head-tail adaptor protein [Ostreiculturibacter nitratireducens]|uniref:head-tail adaptor protein n=1 Tax=Ostreiculturibacter nitratireducens TaxID=3075226 RepID=UPI0031B6196C
MSAPRLNRKLVLEEATRSPDGAGGFTLSWAALGELWAEVKAGMGRERAGEFVTLSTVPFRITVRAAPQGAASRPRPEQRFREGARIFRILAVTEDGPRGEYLTCFAHEEVPA